MKKEKTVRAHQRRTKSGKVITVRQHTSKYNAADKVKKTLKNRNSGKELMSGKLHKQWDDMIDRLSPKALYNMAKYDDFFSDARDAIDNSHLTSHDFIRSNGDRLRKLMKGAARKKNADVNSINYWLNANPGSKSKRCSK